jgi:hypothetical protein
MSIFTFGDRIPSGPDTDLFISYKVEGIPGGVLQGPYSDAEFAQSEFDDIKSYEHVVEVKIVRRHELK